MKWLTVSVGHYPLDGVVMIRHFVGIAYVSPNDLVRRTKVRFVRTCLHIISSTQVYRMVRHRSDRLAHHVRQDAQYD